MAFHKENYVMCKYLTEFTWFSLCSWTHHWTITYV